MHFMYWAEQENGAHPTHVQQFWGLSKGYALLDVALLLLHLVFFDILQCPFRAWKHKTNYWRTNPNEDVHMLGGSVGVLPRNR